MFKRVLSTNTPSRLYNNIINQTTIKRYYSNNKPVDLTFNVIHPSNQHDTSTNDNIIILHGLFGAASNWRSISPKIANETNCNVYQVDQRNHGSSPHVEEFNLVSMVEDIHLMVKKHSIERLSLIGHSMGGKVAMLYSLLYPHTIDKLIVVDISPNNLTQGTLTDFKKYLNAMKSLDLNQLKSRTEAEKYFEPIEQNIIIRRFLLTNLTLNDNGGYKWRINVDSILKHIEELSAFPSPPNSKYFGDTLFVAGGESNYVKPKDYPLIKSYFPNSTIHVVPNTGHWIHAENPQLFTNVVSNFIKYSSPS